MTLPLPSAPRHRGRRFLLGASLAGLFVASGLAGWAMADPQGLETAWSGLIGKADAVPSISGAPSPGTSLGRTGLPTASPAPGTTVVPSGPSLPPWAPSGSPSPSSTLPASQAATMASRLDAALASAKKKFLLPGVEATVIFADGSAWTGALGVADAATGRRVTPTTPFAIASVTKTFTSALILRDVDQGELGLDDPLSRWLPGWPNGRRITIRMLLNHTSGIPDFFEDPAFDTALNTNKKRTWTAAEVLDQVVGSKPLFAPGKGWSYSNTNYVLLGLVAEKVGGAPWNELVRRELIDPLGLTSTYVQAVDPPTGKPARAYRLVAGANGPTPQARTDGTDVVPFTSVITAAGSAGSIASTTQDLARWARALYGGDVLSPATKTQMLTFVKTSSYGVATVYGLGVSRVRFQGRIAYGHTGALAGTRAAIRYFPTQNVTVAVLFNRETFVGDDVVGVLARAIFPTPLPTPSAHPSTGASPRPSATP